MSSFADYSATEDLLGPFGLIQLLGGVRRSRGDRPTGVPRFCPTSLGGADAQERVPPMRSQQVATLPWFRAGGGYLVPLLAAQSRHEKPYPPMSKNHFRSLSSGTRTIIPHSPCRKQAGFQVCGMAEHWPEQFTSMRRQDGGVPSQWWSSIASATGGRRAARWEFHS